MQKQDYILNEDNNEFSHPSFKRKGKERGNMLRNFVNGALSKQA